MGRFVRVPRGNLAADEVVSQAWKPGASSGLMIILGYPGQLIIEGDLGPLRLLVPRDDPIPVRCLCVSAL